MFLSEQIPLICVVQGQFVTCNNFKSELFQVVLVGIVHCGSVCSVMGTWYMFKTKYAVEANEVTWANATRNTQDHTIWY